MALDVDAVIQRIVDSAKKNPRLSELKSVQYGHPDGSSYDSQAPYLVVQAADSFFENAESFGSSASVEKQSSVVIRYSLTVDESDSQSAEKRLLQLLRVLTDEIRKNPRLLDGNNANPVTNRALITTPVSIDSRGSEKQTAHIAVRYQLGSQITLTIPGIAVVYVIEESSGSSTGWQTSDVASDDGTRDVVPVMYSEKKFYKVQTNPVLESQLRNIIRDARPVTVTITENGNRRSVQAMVTEMSPTQVYDELPMAVIRLEI